jgi:hypothetical protein
MNKRNPIIPGNTTNGLNNANKTNNPITKIEEEPISRKKSNTS